MYIAFSHNHLLHHWIFYYCEPMDKD